MIIVARVAGRFLRVRTGQDRPKGTGKTELGELGAGGKV